MEIICPECHFSREVDETKIPARSQVATCPKCKTKFQFRELPEEPVAEPEVAQAPADTPAQPEKPLAEQDAAHEVQASLPVDSTPTVQSDEVAPHGDESEASTTAAKDEGPTFPHIAAPGEEPKEELWDKLHSMAPPEEKEERPEKPEQPHVAPVQQPEAYAAPEQEQQTYQAPSQDQQPIPGWTGEFSDDFPDPMQDDEKDTEEEAIPTVPPPFEQLDRYGFFAGLFMTIKLVLTSPRLFFSVMPVGGGLAKPLTFTILLTMVQGIVQHFWTVAGLSNPIGPDGEPMGGVSAAMAPIIMLLFMPAFIAAGQFIITGVYHLLLKLMKADSQGFEGTFRALAYANAPIIIGIFPMPIPEIEIGWMFVAAFWGLFLTITGLKYIHKTSYAKVVPVALVPLLLAMIAGLLVMGAQLPTI